MFGIRDNKVEEWVKTDEICHSDESKTTQMKTIEDSARAKLSVIQTSWESIQSALAKHLMPDPFGSVGTMAANMNITRKNSVQPMAKSARSATSRTIL